MRRIINIIVTLSFIAGLVIVAISHTRDHTQQEAHHIAELWLNKDCFVGEMDSLEALLLHHGKHLEPHFLDLASSGPGDSELQDIERAAGRHFDRNTIRTVTDSSRRNSLKFLPGERKSYIEAIRSREIMASRIRAVNGLSVIGSKQTAGKLLSIRQTAQPVLRAYIDLALRAINSRRIPK